MKIARRSTSEIALVRSSRQAQGRPFPCSGHEHTKTLADGLVRVPGATCQRTMTHGIFASLPVAATIAHLSCLPGGLTPVQPLAYCP